MLLRNDLNWERTGGRYRGVDHETQDPEINQESKGGFRGQIVEVEDGGASKNFSLGGRRETAGLSNCPRVGRSRVTAESDSKQSSPCPPSTPI